MLCPKCHKKIEPFCTEAGLSRGGRTRTTKTGYCLDCRHTFTKHYYMDVARSKLEPICQKD